MWAIEAMQVAAGGPEAHDAPHQRGGQYKVKHNPKAQI